MTLVWLPVSRPGRGLASMITAAAIIGVILARRVPLVEHLILGRPSFCMMKVVFGIPCLACRGTRAVFALAHGDPGRAILFNPLGTLLVSGGLALAVCAAVTGRIPFLRDLPPPWRILLWCLLGVAALGNWAYVIRAGG
jgi:hypothetical protein